MSATLAAARSWRRPPLIANSWLRWAIYFAALAYLVAALGSLSVNWARLAEGLGRGLRFLQAFAHPNFTSRADDIAMGLQESITMTICATVAGIILSIPVGIGAARNIASGPVYFLCRGI